MSAFIFMFVIFGIGYFVVSLGKGSNSNEIRKRTDILSAARQNSQVTEIISVLNSQRFIELSPEKINTGLRLVDNFIDSNDIRYAEDVKNKLYALINTTNSTSTQQTKETPITSGTVAAAIGLLNKVKRPNAGIYRLKSVLYKIQSKKLPPDIIEDLYSTVEDMYYLIDASQNTDERDEIISDCLYDIVSIIGEEYATELIPDYFSSSPATPITQESYKPKPEEPAVAQAKKETTENIKQEVKKTKAPIKSNSPQSNINEVISALEKAGQAVNDKKLTETVHKILIFLRQAPNSDSLGNYTMYLINMLKELPSKPSYMSMGATIIAENMLETYRSLAEGRNVDVENAFKALRTDLSMRGFSVE